MTYTRKLSPFVLVAAAALVLVALISGMVLMREAVHAATSTPKSTSPSQVTVTLKDTPHTTTASFWRPTVTLTHNKAGKATLRFLNKTKASQTISGGGKTYTVKAGASVLVPLSATTTTFSLKSNPNAQLTAKVN